MHSHVYILTDPIYARNNRFKFGITGCGHAELLSQYSRYIPEATIKFFEPAKDPIEVEKRLKEILKDSLVPNANGNPSEWVDYNYAQLVKLVKSLIKQVDHETSSPIILPCHTPQKRSPGTSPREISSINPSKESSVREVPSPNQNLHELTVPKLIELYYSIGGKQPAPRLKGGLIEAIKHMQGKSSPDGRPSLEWLQAEYHRLTGTNSYYNTKADLISQLEQLETSSEETSSEEEDNYDRLAKTYLELGGQKPLPITEYGLKNSIEEIRDLYANYKTTSDLTKYTNRALKALCKKLGGSPYRYKSGRELIQCIREHSK